MKSRKVRLMLERLKEGQTPQQVLVTGVISFFAGVAASIAGNWILGWYPSAIAKFREVDWLAWLDIPIIAGHRWVWGDLALSVFGGFVVLAIVAALRPLARLVARDDGATSSDSGALAKAQRLMPGLLAEMAADIEQSPLSREFVVLQRAMTYNGKSLVYYYDDHPELDSQLQILQNLDLIRETTYNNAKRFVMTEQLADYLAALGVA